MGKIMVQILTFLQLIVQSLKMLNLSYVKNEIRNGLFIEQVSSE